MTAVTAAPIPSDHFDSVAVLRKPTVAHEVSFVSAGDENGKNKTGDGKEDHMETLEVRTGLGNIRKIGQVADDAVDTFGKAAGDGAAPFEDAFGSSHSSISAPSSSVSTPSSSSVLQKGEVSEVETEMESFPRSGRRRDRGAPASPPQVSVGAIALTDNRLANRP